MSEDLAKRAVACKHWRWLPGMRGHDRGKTFVVISAARDSYTVRFDLPVNRPRRRPPLDLWRFERSGGPPALPRLTDPCTLGGLLALVREAWDVGYGENKYAYIAVNPPVTPHMDEPWSVVVCDHNGEWPFGFDGDTEAEALIEALEAAP